MKNNDKLDKELELAEYKLGDSVLGPGIAWSIIIITLIFLYHKYLT